MMQYCPCTEARKRARICVRKHSIASFRDRYATETKEWVYFMWHIEVQFLIPPISIVMNNHWFSVRLQVQLYTLRTVYFLSGSPENPYKETQSGKDQLLLQSLVFDTFQRSLRKFAGSRLGAASQSPILQTHYLALQILMPRFALQLD